MIHFFHWLLASDRPPLETQTTELRRRLKDLREQRAAEMAAKEADLDLAETIERYEKQMGRVS